MSCLHLFLQLLQGVKLRLEILILNFQPFEFLLGMVLSARKGLLSSHWSCMPQASSPAKGSHLPEGRNCASAAHASHVHACVAHTGAVHAQGRTLPEGLPNLVVKQVLVSNVHSRCACDVLQFFIPSTEQ